MQDESQASYEGWCRAAEAKIDWAKPIDHVYNLIRGCNPAPGAWTTFNGQEAADFRRSQDRFPALCRRAGEDRRGHRTSRRRASRSRPRAALIEVLKAKFEDGKKVSGGELAQSGGIERGSLLGS